MKLYIILVALLGVLLLATGCSDDANNYNQTMVDPDNATYWDQLVIE